MLALHSPDSLGSCLGCSSAFEALGFGVPSKNLLSQLSARSARKPGQRCIPSCPACPQQHNRSLTQQHTSAAEDSSTHQRWTTPLGARCCRLQSPARTQHPSLVSLEQLQPWSSPVSGMVCAGCVMAAKSPGGAPTARQAAAALAGMRMGHDPAAAAGPGALWAPCPASQILGFDLPSCRPFPPVPAGMGAAYGTAKSGVGIASMGVMRPELVMKSIVPVVMAGVLGIYGLIIAVIISTGGGLTPCTPSAGKQAPAAPGAHWGCGSLHTASMLLLGGSPNNPAGRLCVLQQHLIPHHSSHLTHPASWAACARLQSPRASTRCLMALPT